MTESTIKILTHDGRFHADEVIACAFLSLLVDEDDAYEIVRSRKMENLDQYKWIVDVGKVYDPDNGRFDHHQENCYETWPESPILLSSCGMVFLHLWSEIFEKMGYPDATWQEANMVYKKVILPIDAHDNGQVVNQHNYTFRYLLECGHKGYGEGIQVGRVIADMNHDDVNSEEQMIRFTCAVQYALHSFVPVISTMLKKTRSNNAMVEKLKDIDISSGILVLPKKCYTNEWILRKIDPEKKLFFTVYEKKKGEWGFSAIQDKKFTNRVDLIHEDFDMYPSLIFIHKKLFCGSCSNKDDAIDICWDSIAKHKDKQLKKSLFLAALSLACLSCVYYFS